WWRRLTARLTVDSATQQKSLYFNAASQRAAVSERHSYTSQRNVVSLLEEQSLQTTWDKKLMKTVFDLVVPNDLKLVFRSQQNLLLLLDKYTAIYPWEMMHYDEQAEQPLCVTSGMIRQLATTFDKKFQKPIEGNKVLILGDPLLSAHSKIPQLPAARREATLIDTLFFRSNHPFETTLSIQEDSSAVMKALFSEYKMIHIASHGVVDYVAPNELPRTGLLLSNDTVLTTAEIEKMETVPEMVFINSCYAGQISWEAETTSRSKYNLAANIGTHFIEQGAKVVIVAGWAIHDEAALVFAEIFYEQMLAGSTFAEAVLAARQQCFEQYPNNNTWGAYQCYGDQNYRLVKKRSTVTPNRNYKDQIDALADLERLINDAKSSRKRAADDFAKNLGALVENLKTSKLSNGRTLELAAAAYAEIMDFEKAIGTYQSLWSDPKAAFSFKSIEQLLNLEARFVVQQFKDLSPEVADQKRADFVARIDEVINELHLFNKKGITEERYNILASAYRRKSMILVDKSAKIKAINQMATHYALGYQKSEAESIYSLSNWLIAERFTDKTVILSSNDQEAIEALKIRQNLFTQYLPKKNIAEFLDQRTKALSTLDVEDFWDLITNVNLHQCRLLYVKESGLAGVVQQIKKEYKKAWKIDGSYRQKASETDQMNFIRTAVSLFFPNKKKLLAACEQLCTFFEDLE
ncbi:MAG: CHAT domain-containing protein, partial [Bacteroidota bacterium]